MIKVAIDMGSSVTKIYRIGSGIVLAEASCVAVNIETGKIKAIGNDAKQLLGRTAEFTAIHFPVSGGVIKDEKLAIVMLRHFLQKTEIKPGQFINVHAIICVPCGINAEVCSAYYRIADKCGIGKISFVEVPYLAATGMNAPMSDISPVFSIDIGGGSTNIAVVSLDGIIAGVSINVGGADIDRGIADKIADVAGLRVGPLTSERLKNEVGSLIEGDGKSKVVNGRDISSGRPASLNVSSVYLSEPIAKQIDLILKYAEMVLQKISAEVSASVYKTGIFLSGGVSQIPGLRDYVSEKFAMDVHTSEESSMAVVLGAGKAVEDASLLKKIKINC